MNELITQWVNHIPNIAGQESWISTAIAAFLVLILAALAFVIAKSVFVYLIHKLFVKTASDLDDILIRRKVLYRLAYLAPSWVIYTLMPAALEGYPLLANMISTVVAIYSVVVFAVVVDSVIDSLMDMYRSFSISRQIPIQSFAQVAKLVTYFIAIISIVSLMIGESPLKLFAGLGALTAVLMLIFKDPILGFVAGIQLSFNNMVGIGDWVEIPQHNADGDIMEIGLTTVKVRNFDNTITTVPTQSLINESFKNWRGMQDSGGRRIKRSIFLDVNSISFCNEEQLARYSKVDYIKEYLESKRAELEQYNAEHANAQESLVNGRRITNVGTFRAYILAYIENHPQINKKLTVLVRQLAPSEAGLPIEIYAFSSEKNWIKYEAIQADIFDHLFAVANEFDLRVFQKPSGSDFSQITKS
ncbi:MAG: miniconductance mechanosensitive channel [Pseudoalteromonas tetraodonis]|jgi:miniconductance mechanosensitive channel